MVVAVVIMGVNVFKEIGSQSKKLRLSILLCFTALFFVLSSHNTSVVNAVASSQYAASPIDFNQMNLSRIMSDVDFFSSLGTRVTGYLGYEKSTDYIVKTFSDMGFGVQIHEYYIPVPLDRGCWITVDQGPYGGSNFTAYALWPNAGVSSTNGDFPGKLLYVKEGTLKDMTGLDIQDSIILLDFNSGKNWINAVRLGAKGAVFIKPFSTTKYEALDKGSLAPIHFPRLYVNRTVGEMLRKVAENDGIVTMHVNMKWENVKAKNIVGILEGENPDDVLILSAHYDSWSIVPAVSSAAEDSVGVSTLLELARYFKANRPRQTLWFVAYSGHWEGRLGAVEFTEDILFNTTKRTWLQIGLDISSEAPYMDCLYLSSIYGSMQPESGWGTMTWVTIYALTSAWTVRFSWIESLSRQFLNVPVENVGSQIYAPPRVQVLGDFVKYALRAEGTGSQVSWAGTQTDFYMLDTEPSLSATMMAATLRTQYARRISWLNPLNTPIVWKNVWPQVMTILTLVNGFANVDAIPYDWNIASPKRWYISAQTAAGFTTLYGKTVEFSNETGWYKPLGHSLVRLYIFDPQASNAWPFSYRYTFSDEEGQFVFHGLIPYLNWQVDAWKLSRETGRIEYVVDRGYYGTAEGVAGGLRTIVYPITASVSTLVPLFRCEQITLFDLIDVRTMRNLIIRDYRNPNHNYFNEYTTSFGLWGGRQGATFGFGLGVYEAKSKSAPVFVGMYAGADGITDLYLQTGERIVITFNPNPGQLSWPTMILSNSSRDSPEGDGLAISESMTIPLTAYRSMVDMYRMVTHRYGGFYSFGVRVTYAEQMLERATYYLNEANSSYVSKDYDGMYHQSYLALQYLSKAYSESVMPMFNEAAISVMFFSMLILPFSILFERLILQWTSYRRFIGIFCLMALFFVCYAFVHPAFSIMSNSFMTVVSVGVLLLLVTIVTIFVTDMKDLLETVRVSMLGEHVFRSGRVSIVMHTLNASVENMRKRPLLTSLALTSIICFTTAQTAFTSTSYGFSMVRSPGAHAPPYTGILVKNIYGMPPESRGGPLSMPTVRYLQGLGGDDYLVSPRVWMYPQPQRPETLPVTELVTTEGIELRLSPFVFMGLSSRELQIVFQGHISGPGNFTGRHQCVIPSGIADLLKAEVGDKIYIRGLDDNFTVIGITDLTEQIRDFDGKFLLPIHPGFEQDLSLMETIYPAGMEPTPVPTTSVIYIPWETALERGGFISSIALIPKVEKAAAEMEELASTITVSTSLVTHVGTENTEYSLSTIFSYFFHGWDVMIVVLMALIVLSLVNFMLGTFVTRKREIETYSTLGLSPGGVIIIFFTENVTLAFGGTLIGYLIGFALNQIFISFKMLPSSFAFNFVSLPVVISMTLLICAVLIASLYPASLAAKLVTPSLERRWRAATRPVGDIWEIAVPLKAKKFEALGILKYFQEYFSGAGSARGGFRILKVSEVDAKDLELSLDVILTPVELNMTQTAIIKCKEEKKEHHFALVLNRKTGDPKVWQSRNRAFIDDVRKQALLWKGLLPDQRQKYIS